MSLYWLLFLLRHPPLFAILWKGMALHATNNSAVYYKTICFYLILSRCVIISLPSICKPTPLVSALSFESVRIISWFKVHKRPKTAVTFETSCLLIKPNGYPTFQGNVFQWVHFCNGLQQGREYCMLMIFWCEIGNVFKKYAISSQLQPNSPRKPPSTCKGRPKTTFSVDHVLHEKLDLHHVFAPYLPQANLR